MSSDNTVTDLAEQLALANTHITRLLADNDELKRRDANLVHAVKLGLDESTRLQETIATHKDRNEALHDALTARVEEVDRLRAELDISQSCGYGYSDNYVHALRGELTTANKRVEDLTLCEVALRDGLKTLNEEVYRLHTALGNVTSTLGLYKNNLKQVGTQNQELHAKIDALTSENSQLTRDVEFAGTELLDARSHINRLQDAMDELTECREKAPLPREPVCWITTGSGKVRALHQGDLFKFDFDGISLFRVTTTREDTTAS